MRKCLEILKAMEIIIDKAIDKVNIVKIDDIIYLFILKFNKNQYDSKINSIITVHKSDF